MNRPRCRDLCLLGVCALPSAGAQEPQPYCWIAASPGVRFEPGADASFQVACLLWAGRGDIVMGASGWSVSVASRGWPIIHASLMSTVAELFGASPIGQRRDDGFATVELRTAPDGTTFATSSCIISASGLGALPFSTGYQRILQLTLSGDPPQPGAGCLTVDLRLADWVPAEGTPVMNEVTWNGKRFPIGALPSAVLVCPRKDVSCDLAPANLFFARTAVPDAGHETARVNAGLLTTSVEDDAVIEVFRPPGRYGEATIFLNLSSQNQIQCSGRDLCGVEGWSLSVAAAGGIDLVDATFAGTASAIVPDGLVNGGFHSLRIVDPELPHLLTGLPQGQGVVAAVILDFTGIGYLEPVGTATVLAMTFRERDADGKRPAEGWVYPLDGLGQGGSPDGAPSWYFNDATLSGETLHFCAKQRARIRFLSGPPFVRCDSTGDGVLDISDPIRTLDALFRNGPPFECIAASDCNADLGVDLLDVVYALHFLFLGGFPPPAPYPQCGFAPGAACSPDRSSGCR